jgi:hypothetical protein
LGASGAIYALYFFSLSMWINDTKPTPDKLASMISNQALGMFVGWISKQDVDVTLYLIILIILVCSTFGGWALWVVVLPIFDKVQIKRSALNV